MTSPSVAKVLVRQYICIKHNVSSYWLLVFFRCVYVFVCMHVQKYACPTGMHLYIAIEQKDGNCLWSITKVCDQVQLCAMNRDHL